jgi:hypothetical protein
MGNYRMRTTARILNVLPAMVEFRVNLDIQPGKTVEVRQTLASVVPLIRRRSGCRKATYRITDGRNGARIVQGWGTSSEFHAYVRSPEHHILMGAFGTLCSGFTMEIRSRNDGKRNAPRAEER